MGRFEPKMKAAPPPTSNVPSPPSPLAFAWYIEITQFYGSAT